MSSYAAHILPLDNQYRPDNITEFGREWIAECVAYVFSKPQRTRPTRVVVSHGDLGAEWDTGTTHAVYHDQTNALLGVYTVVGIVVYDDSGHAAYTEGEVPDRKLATAVFK